MSTSLFQSVPNWSFGEKEEKALSILDGIRAQAISQLPESYKTQKVVLLFKEIQSTTLYSILKKMPKGVMHHVHFDCCEDQQFYAESIINDPIVYLNKDLNKFELGTKEKAEGEGWVSMQTLRAKFEDEVSFVRYVSNITMFNLEELGQLLTQSSEWCWIKFEEKISGMFPLLAATHILKKYTTHILRKFIRAGYDRIQFRALLVPTIEYDEKGEIVKVHEKTKFMEIVDEAYDIVKAEYPTLSVGFILFCLKMFKSEYSEQFLMDSLQPRWSKTIGIDFVQEEDKYDIQTPYDEVANKVLSKFPDLNLSKVYHCGETQNHENRNIELAIKAGSVRIGHGINVVHHPELIQICKQKGICFEKCPVSNLILNYVKSPRGSSPQLLLGLGVPVSLSPDDPARFGLEDTTMDFFVLFVNSNWSLKHLKLLGIHSINHAICSQEAKKELIESFNKRWAEWIDQICI